MSNTERDPRLIDAEIAKFAAEAEKFKAEALSLAADTKIKEAEARQKIAHAIAAEHGAESMRVQTDATLRQERLSLAANHHHHEFMFNAVVRGDEVETCLAQMAVWDRLDAYCDMNITMDSPGGSLIDGMHLFDQLLTYSKRPWDDSDNPKGLHSTRMTVRGYAASMAGILLQAADERVIGAHSLLMIHEVSSIAGGKIGDIKDEVKMLDKVSDDVVDIFVKRSNGKMSPDEFKKNWNRTDWWLTAKEALDFGFVDRIG